MKNSSLKQKLKTSLTPLKVGFLASCVFHSSLFAFLVVDFSPQCAKSMRSQSINIGLANISGDKADSQKMQAQKPKPHKKPHKHHKRHHKKIPKPPVPVVESEIPRVEPMPEVVESAEIVEVAESADSTDSTNETEIAESATAGNGSVDSTLGSSTNLGERIEILGDDDAMYASILDIINKNREYPRMARVRKIFGKVQVEFVLLADGGVKAVRITRGRHQILDDNAVETIKKVADLFPKPERDKKVRIILVYDLTS